MEINISIIYINSIHLFCKCTHTHLYTHILIDITPNSQIDASAFWVVFISWSVTDRMEMSEQTPGAHSPGYFPPCNFIGQIISMHKKVKILI